MGYTFQQLRRTESWGTEWDLGINSQLGKHTLSSLSLFKVEHLIELLNGLDATSEGNNYGLL